MGRRLLVAVIVGCLLLLVGAMTVSVLILESAQPNETVTLAQSEEVDRTVFNITVYENGDARWTVENRRTIPRDDEEAISEFESFAQRFLEEETETFLNFKERADRLTQEGTDLTGREMNATDFQRDATYQNISQEGVVEMSFRWDGFAHKDGDTVTVSDVFSGGFVILEDQTLRFERSDGLRFESVPSAFPPDRTGSNDGNEPSQWVEWEGPLEFSNGQPELVFTTPDNGTAGGQDEDDGTVDEDGSDPPEAGDSDMMIPIAVMLFVVLSVGIGAVWYTMFRSRDEYSETVPPESPSDPAVGQESGPDLQQEQFLSDEDRVLSLLEENGGRMRQVSIVEETEWSKSKVSMLLSEMEENDDISKLRVGRENIISLSGEEPEAAGSPFEDEENG